MDNKHPDAPNAPAEERPPDDSRPLAAEHPPTAAADTDPGPDGSDDKNKAEADSGPADADGSDDNDEAEADTDAARSKDKADSGPADADAAESKDEATPPTDDELSPAAENQADDAGIGSPADSEPAVDPGDKADATADPAAKSESDDEVPQDVEPESKSLPPSTDAEPEEDAATQPAAEPEPIESATEAEPKVDAATETASATESQAQPEPTIESDAEPGPTADTPAESDPDDKASQPVEPQADTADSDTNVEVPQDVEPETKPLVGSTETDDAAASQPAAESEPTESGAEPGPTADSPAEPDDEAGQPGEPQADTAVPGAKDVVDPEAEAAAKPESDDEAPQEVESESKPLVGSTETDEAAASQPAAESGAEPGPAADTPAESDTTADPDDEASQADTAALVADAVVPQDVEPETESLQPAASATEVETESVADTSADAVGEPVAEAPAGAVDLEEERRPRRVRRYVLLAAAAVVLLLVGAWAVDSAASSDQVARNVEVAGQDVSSLDEQELRGVVFELNSAQTERPVTINAGDKVYETTAGALGLSVNESATVDAALDAGQDGNPLLRPLSWLASFVRPRDVAPRYSIDEAQAAANLEALQGADRTAPVEPTMPLGEAGFAMVPGQAGQGIDPATFTDLLQEGAEDSTEGRIVIDTDVTTLEPAYTDDEVRLLAERANDLTAAGLSVKAGPNQIAVPAAQLRTWIDLAPTENGLDLAINNEAVNASLPALVGVVGEAPVNATVTLDPNGTPVVVPGRNGVTCCGDDSGTRIWDALGASQPQVELVVREAEPDWTTAEVQAWGITQPIGGSRAWRNGGEVPGPAPGFTTYHDCCAARVKNIQRLADMIRGAVIPPGGDFSINDYVGPRTAAKGFVLAGAIAQGMHVDEIGGGVSQFATTTFNAAYFAGLDITTYQAHTEYFSRYPRGREATMGYPKPDLGIHNNTPYGLMIWTSYTETSLTVTFYSTPWAAAEQTGSSESRHGGCRTVVTTRTRYFPDGTTADDTFKATYRPGEGQFC